MFQLYEPHPALKEFVNNIVIHQVKFDVTETEHTFFIPPVPENALFFYLRDSLDSENLSTQTKKMLSPCTVTGPTFHQHSITPGRDHLMIKVGFQPGGLYRFLGIPMTELLSQDGFDGTQLVGNEINEVHDQLKGVASFDKIKMIVENFLLKHVIKLKQILPFDQALAFLIKGRGLIKIDQLASYACLSFRQFERVFEQRIGLSPKYFSRLVRFEKAWITKQQQPDISWIKIAYECGYFDQMHLIRDFQEFAGVSPTSIESELMKLQVQFFNRRIS